MQHSLRKDSKPADTSRFTIANALNDDPENPSFAESAESHYRLGRDQKSSGELQLARESFQRALAIDPGFAPAALGIGQICYDLGRSSEALQYLERALQRDPTNAETLCYCGRALADIGQTDLALVFLRRAVEAANGELSYTLATVDVLQDVEFSAHDPWYEKFLSDCFDNPLVTHAALTNAATSLLWNKPAVQNALQADRLETAHIAALAQEPLLFLLLSKTMGRSWAFEEFFTKLRLRLAELRDPEHLTLVACVAEQAFNSGYVQFQSDSEAALESILLERDVRSLTPVEIAVLASYRALADVPDAAAILNRTDLPDVLQSVVLRTLREPLEEREIETSIERLTPINDIVSQRVRSQYEDYPYPRWINIQSVDIRNERLVDEIAQHAMNFKNPGWPERPKVLVPGCGTGYHPLSLSRKHPETDVLAVDLSRTSLAYAIRKQRELQFLNVRFCQADLLELAEFDAQFEYIDCAGVLHHMEAPLAGWRILARLLKPGGVMRIGLYSELARKTIVSARSKIAERNIPSTPSAIRQFRNAIMNDPSLSELRSLARTTADFFSMGDIRDLVFHVQEHRFDIPTVKRYLDALGLEFGGFLLADRKTVLNFHASNPRPSQWLDLDCWAEFEARNPNTFFRMYQFYCLKR